MFYSDDAVDTQLIGYTATASQGLGVTVRIQLGGLIGLGLNVERIEGVTECGRFSCEMGRGRYGGLAGCENDGGWVREGIVRYGVFGRWVELERKNSYLSAGHHFGEI